MLIFLNKTHLPRKGNPMKKRNLFLIVLAGTLIGGGVGFNVSEHFRKEAALEQLEQDIQETDISTAEVIQRLESIEPGMGKAHAQDMLNALQEAEVSTSAPTAPAPAPAG